MINAGVRICERPKEKRGGREVEEVVKEKREVNAHTSPVFKFGIVLSVELNVLKLFGL